MWVTRNQTVTFLYLDVGFRVVTKSGSFVDVSADAYYAAAVEWAVAENVTNGISATTFSPDDACTCAQVATILMRFINRSA